MREAKSPASRRGAVLDGSPDAPRPLRLYRPGMLDYEAAWRWQRETAEAVRNGAGEAIALLQHPPTYSFGRRIRRENLLVAPEALRTLGAVLVESDRGGDITFHGPGQVVCYPILNLRRRNLGAGDYVRLLEQTMIRALGRFGIEATTVRGRPGVWVGGAKIGAVGVRVQGGVTTHGFALNVDPDLVWYDAIVPCGLADAGVTSLAQLGIAADIEAVEEAIIEEVEKLLGVTSTHALDLAPRSSEGEGPGERLAPASRASSQPRPEHGRDAQTPPERLAQAALSCG